MELVERIENTCKQKGYSIMKLEKESGLSNGQIRKWKTQKPSYDKVAAVANTLNVTIDWLITGKDAKDLSPDEQKLLEYYRRSNSITKQTIMNVAEMGASTNYNSEQKSSDTKIG